MDRNAIAQHVARRLTDGFQVHQEQYQFERQVAPYFTVDDLLPDDIARHAFALSPTYEQMAFVADTFNFRKRSTNKTSALTDLLGEILFAQQDPSVLEIVGKITQIPNLESDPTLYATGLNIMGKGDFIAPHLDNSHDSPRRRYRRLNSLYYFTPEWTFQDGGHLKLWDRKVKEGFIVDYKFNRLVIMMTNNVAFHSVEPIMGDRFRYSIATTYYAEESPSNRDYFHVTEFSAPPQEPLKRGYNWLHAKSRSAIAHTLGLGRGKHRVYGE